DSIVDVQTAEDEQASKQFKMRLRNALLALALFVPGSLMVSLILARLYSTSIVRPLNRLKENSVRLSQLTDLSAPIGGNDEIGDLEREFQSAAQLVRKSLAEEKLLIENAMAVILHLQPDGVIVSANNATKELLDIEANELVERSIFELVDPLQHATLDQFLNDICLKQTSLASIELQMNGNAGVLKDTGWSAFWSDSRKGIVLIVHDIGEEKRVQRMRQNLHDMITKDVQLPIESIADTLAKCVIELRDKPDASVQKDIDRAFDTARYLRHFAEQLNALRQTSFEWNVADIAPQSLLHLAGQARDLVISVASRRNVEVQLGGEEMIVSCDREKVLQVMNNLLSNAVRFSPDDGRITVGFDDEDTDIRVRIEDEGPGVEEADRDLIFDSFVQARSNAGKVGGTGLGLAICKKIVLAHGGTIGVTERRTAGGEVTAGSMFWFRLPKTRS
ncbi:MAG: sensor histidine kinase, partial [Terriglobales bacterium]